MTWSASRLRASSRTPCASRRRTAKAFTVSNSRKRVAGGPVSATTSEESTRSGNASSAAVGVRPASTPTSRAIAPVNGPANSPSRSRRAATSAGSSRYDHSIVAARLRCRGSPAEPRPASTSIPSARRARISAGCIVRVRAAASSIASGTPSSWRQRLTTASSWSSGTGAPSSRARSRNRRTASLAASTVPAAGTPSGPRTTNDSSGRSRGDRLVARTVGARTGLEQGGDGVGGGGGDVLAVVDDDQRRLVGRRHEQRLERGETELAGDRSGDGVRGRRRGSGRRRATRARTSRRRPSRPPGPARSCRSRRGR